MSIDLKIKNAKPNSLTSLGDSIILETTAKGTKIFRLRFKPPLPEELHGGILRIRK